MTQKVVAYITCRGRLLVFRQPVSPEAGVQVPAGTMDPGETPAAAVLREAHEETGLDDLAIRAYLGARDFQFERPSGQRERVRRHYFHLVCDTADVTRRWIHLETNPSEGPAGPIPFELYWVKYPEEVPPLAGSLDEMLAALYFPGNLSGKQRPYRAWSVSGKVHKEDTMNAHQLLSELEKELEAVPEKHVPTLRRVRRAFSRRLKDEPADLVIALAGEMVARNYRRWIAYELVADHPAAYRSLDRETLERLGRGIDSWNTVDSFGRTLSGPAWRDGLLDDDAIHAWAQSADRWWRRAALVSTVALNIRSHGGYGDSERTLAICEMLADDHDDMVIKALSWALRALVVHDPAAVRAFLKEHDHVLAARVKREVTNKLETGLKNP